MHGHKFSCSLVYLFKFISGPLEKGSRISNECTAQVFIPFIRFLLVSFVWSSFLVLLQYSFWILPFISTCLMVSASKMPNYLLVSFSPSVQILSLIGCSIPSVRCHLPLFITLMAHFSMPNSIPTSWLYILTACIWVYSSFSFFANSLISSIYIRWLTFSCGQLSLYPAVHFLNMWLSDIMAITNSKGDWASPWNMSLWIFASAKLTGVNCWSFSRVGVTAIRLKSPGLFLVFCPILTSPPILNSSSPHFMRASYN